MRICVITYYWKVVVGPGAQLCTLLEVWVLGVGMSTLDTQTSLYIEDYRDSTVRQRISDRFDPVYPSGPH
jgi:hypothetical protein